MTATDTTIRIEAVKLASALARLMPLIRENSLVPALSAVMMETNYCGELLLTAGSDTQRMSVIVPEIELDGGEYFACCPELSPLFKIVQTLPDVPVWITDMGTHVELSSATSLSRIPSFPAKDYPTLGLDKRDTVEPVTLPDEDSATLGFALQSAFKFSGSDLTFQPQFYGVWLSPREGYLSLETSNGRIISDEAVPVPWIHDSPVQLTYEGVTAAARLLQTGGSVSVELLPSWVGFGTTNDQLWVRRLNPVYPNFPILWPADDQLTATITVERIALAGTLKRILSMPGLPAKGNLSTHTAKLAVVDDTPRLSYTYGDYQIEEVVGEWDGPALGWPCGVDVKNLQIVVSSFTGTTLTIQLNASASGRKFLLIEDGESTNRAMLMATLI
jgi:DNA polymerase III sliding clamp (beta) subunit (PCNA family)